jgi:hypothetical protein
MELRERVAAFEKLGAFLKEQGTGVYTSHQAEHKIFEKLILEVRQHNAWFGEKNVRSAIGAIAECLDPGHFQTWLRPNEERLGTAPKPQKVAVIMAGNIPLVGFHDFLCVLISGHHFLGKPSSDDHLLIPFLAALLLQFEPRFKDSISFTEGRMNDLEAVIATGSSNSSRYFDYYFGKYPHIIRKNRHSVAILDGTETPADFEKLGRDIFMYYGLGCRNVSKLFVPEGYRFDPFFEGIFSYSDVLQNNKYVNNYEYNKTIYLLNSEKLLDNNFLLLRQEIALSSPIGVLFYEYYSDTEALKSRLQMDAPFVQCLVSKEAKFAGSLPFGQSQSPMLWDYADGVDTMQFLLGL